MSTRPEDRLVNLLSHWLARHVGEDELRHEVAAVSGLEPEHAAAVAELREALGAGAGRQQLEVAVRETLEALALDG